MADSREVFMASTTNTGQVFGVRFGYQQIVGARNNQDRTMHVLCNLGQWGVRTHGFQMGDERLFFILNAALFSFSHIIFRNWLAIVLTFAGGLMFAWTYRKSKSLMVVFIEHMLYGNFIFTVGIGQYFYLPLGG